MFKSLYPSIDGENNIAANTQVGKIEIPHKIYKNENAYRIEVGYSRSGEFIENKVTDNIIEFAHRWFHLGSVQDLIKAVDERVASNDMNYNIKYPVRYSNRDRYKHPIRIINRPRKATLEIKEYNNTHRKGDIYE